MIKYVSTTLRYTIYLKKKKKKKKISEESSNDAYAMFVRVCVCVCVCVCVFPLIFFIKAYAVGTRLNCIDKSMLFKWISTTYVFIKK